VAAEESEDLLFDNGIGGFKADGTEYHIRLRAGAMGGLDLPPMPWVNIVANERCGFLVSETGAGYTWSRNSREHKLTPWFNDPISDPHGEALLLRDQAASEFWSPLPGPAPDSTDYTIDHGFGYTRFRHTSRDLEQETCLFVERTQPVKLIRLRLRNLSQETRRLSLYSYQHLIMGVLPDPSVANILTEFDEANGILTATKPGSEDFSTATAFTALVMAEAKPALSLTCDRAAFLGRHGDIARPIAVEQGGVLDGAVGQCADPCFALRTLIELGPGASTECTVLFGEMNAGKSITDLVGHYRQAGVVTAAFEEATAYWRELLTGVQIETPAPAIDLMVNGWLLYQTLSCRLWGRSAFYQSGGAFGFRDQLQDAAAWVHTRPEILREQLLLHAAHQFVEGDVLHWWHPPRSRGIRTRFADDLLWLPYLTAFYLHVTGDTDLLAERARFITARALTADEDETYLLPADSGTDGDVYEHCIRALDRSLTRGAHGLPLMGTGDWNDGMNRVGREGHGESVWLGFFLYSILGDFTPYCAQRGDTERQRRYESYRADLSIALNAEGWDGGWYRRGYYDDGAPLGSAQSDECRIDALAQAWAVLSGVAPPDRAVLAMNAVDDQLISERDGLIRLLTPPFDRTPHDVGYIKGYVPGIRENGGQYTHAALWVVRAMAELGRHDRAAKLLAMLSPVTHSRTPEEIGVYQVEPYVAAADVYGSVPHIGRGGWTWYTGSAAWMYRVALESVLGIVIEHGRRLRVRPCIPDEWPGFRVRYRLPHSATVYNIKVTRRAPGGLVVSATLDAVAVEITDGYAQVPLLHNDEHVVELTIGGD
jgi:cyclic beta-1,2-glucan synthetase